MSLNCNLTHEGICFINKISSEKFNILHFSIFADVKLNKWHLQSKILCWIFDDGYCRVWFRFCISFEVGCWCSLYLQGESCRFVISNLSKLTGPKVKVFSRPKVIRFWLKLTIKSKSKPLLPSPPYNVGLTLVSSIVSINKYLDHLYFFNF